MFIVCSSQDSLAIL